ncbi:hypothetical protein ACWT_7469 [Actinoplanes sp. SE50]|uniref:UPF0182 family membrane protein n=1 Tax=unclassified Actinoplanes TaxID=2626549 RepID=UPI00023EE0BE|nr:MULTISPECIES: UPF0182 family protein [unclassified Actinoplanes]AEV88479.1 uncharacterized protein ACPL_7599 [Actinoplanes sp. SE50/110]ATO86884.1 hypothetical protein ACWT_7469 [Actinoplanes sp. SE50]SLM04302.1 uncharacterized protein ACSP50_7607 [Actinoplanes sp. SE50/110]
MSRRGRVTVGVLVGVFILFTLLGWGIDAYTDYLWFSEVDFANVFSGVLVTRLLLFLTVGAVLALIVGANLYLAYRLRPLLRPHSAEQATLERYRMVLTPRLGTWITVLSVIIGFFAGLSAQSRWADWMLFRNAQPFGQTDPQFHVDIGFYIFDYPLLRYLLGLGFTAVVLSVLGALAVHYIFGGVRLQGVGDRMTTAARAHLTTLVAVFVLLKAVAYVLDRRALLLEQHVSPGLYGAGYTDVNALLPAKEILAYISIVVAVAIIVFSNAVMRNLVWPGVSLALLGISAVAIGGIYPLAVQNFQVKPSLSDKERPYIAKAIEATRDAFDLNATKVTDYTPVTAANGSTPPPANLADDTSAQNVRLIDPQLVSQAFTQSQQSRSFYDFGEKLDVDRYTIDNKTQDFVVGAREINDEKLSAQQRNWLNRHTVYTHGYGLVAAPANKVCEGAGLPYFVSGFLGSNTSANCSAPTDELEATQPRIYYGEQSTEYAIVGQTDKSRSVEFDRPKERDKNAQGQDEDKEASDPFTYDGKGGVAIGSFFRRLVFAIKNTESNFLLSDAVNANSKVMYIRTPRERVEKVAPFLTIDGDPYPAVVDGKIVWILDGYTTAQTYPYAQKINLANETRDETTGAGAFPLARDDVNYMRNSVKATVDAYDGTVKLYEFDTKDPVLKAWNQAFGGHLIIPKGDTPADLIKHFRYPADLFKVQRNLLTRFHVQDPQTFFTGDDFWQVPNAPDAPQAGVKQPPFYLNVKLPVQSATTFQLTSGVTPNGRDNMAALISASYDTTGAPQLQVLKLPNNSVTPGPVQVHRLMTNNAGISQQLFALNRNGQTVLYGNLISLPLQQGILYVEPVYVRTTAAGAAPLLQKVLMSYGDGSNVVLENNLQDGLKALAAAGKNNNGGTGTGGNTGTTPPASGTGPPVLSGDLASAAAAVDQAIENLRNAQKSGDFVAQGNALKALDDAMSRFQQASQAKGGTTTGTGPSVTPSTAANPAPSASAGG